MEKIKVLHIAQSNGGVSQYLKMFFKYCDRKKFSNEMICSELYKSEFHDFENLGVKMDFIKMDRDVKIINDLKSLINVYKKIKEIKPDIIYCHSSKGGVYGRIGGAFLNIPVIYNSHGWSFNMRTNKFKKIFYEVTEKVLAKVTSKIVVISQDEYDCAIKYKICNEDKLQLITNGIDLNGYDVDKNKDAVLSKLGIPKGSYVIGMVARITEQKGPETFLKIAKDIIKKYDNVYFIYVGDGDMKEEIMKQISSEKLNEKVIITGWINKVANYINIFDIALLTSKWEGFGLVVLEYMLLGKPVIASNVGGIKNIITQNQNGILIECDNVKEFNKAIIRIKEDEQLKNKIVNNAISIIQKEFNVEKLVKKHETLFCKLVKGID